MSLWVTPSRDLSPSRWAPGSGSAQADKHPLPGEGGMCPGTWTGCDTVGWKTKLPPTQPPWRSVLLLPWCVCFNAPWQALGIARTPAAWGTHKPPTSLREGGREPKCCFRAVSSELTNKGKQMCEVGMPGNKAKHGGDSMQRAG